MTRELPVSGAVAHVVNLCGDRFALKSNGVLEDELDLLSVVVLACQEAAEEDPDSRVVAAKNRLIRLGFGNRIPLTYTERMALYALASWRISSERHPVFFQTIGSLTSREPREIVREIWARCLRLWDRIVADRQTLHVDCAEIESRLAKILPEF